MEAASISNNIDDNKYGNCRCCLSIGHHEHIFGMPEMELLMENLNLVLLADPRLPHLLCSECFTSLNEVQSFRQKVLQSEAELHQIIQQENNQSAKTIITEVSAFSANVKKQTKNEPFEMIVLKSDDVNDSLLREASDNTADASHTFRTVKIELDSEDFEDSPSISPEEVPGTGPQLHSIERSEFTSQFKKKKDLYIPEHIMIDDKIKVATDNTKIRANLVLIVQNSTILPFRCTSSHVFKCFYCEKKFSIFKDLRKHTETEHKDGETGHSVYKRLLTRQHKMIHADISDTKCKMCHDKFDNIDDLVKHLTGTHKKVYYDVKRSETGPSHGVLATHLDSDIPTCHICGKEFVFYKQMINHMAEHTDSFVCPKCGKKLMTEARLKNHLMTHDKADNKCPECKKVFTSKFSLKVHTKRRHEGKFHKIIKCGECDRHFPTQSKKIEHMEKIHGLKRPEYKCEFCEKVYNISSSLNSHRMEVHIKTNELICDICAYATSNKGVMKRHVDYHNGVKNFECDYCKKKFRTKNSIYQHISKHLNLKRFACCLCDAAFIQKHCLKKHIKSKHPESRVNINTLKFDK